jgi:hypothetical protein
MTRLAEDYDYDIGGAPEPDTIDLAVPDTATGGLRAHLQAPADGPDMHAWSTGPGTMHRTAMAPDHQASRVRGLREAIRALAPPARQLVSRTKAINQLKSLLMLARTAARPCAAARWPIS